MNIRTTKPNYIKVENLAYWYFRLNGFLTIPNFVVHPDLGTNQRTDVDILGVRFPYRKELLVNPMKDHEIFTRFKDRPLIIIAEVKRRECDLNGPWTDPVRKNMERVLRAVGAYSGGSITLDKISKQLYEDGFHESDQYVTSLVCVGETKNPEISKSKPKVIQVTYDEILSFIYNRFSDYKRQKTEHPQWDEAGKTIWEIFDRIEIAEEYIRTVKSYL